MVWAFLVGTLGLTIVSGAVLGAALGLTGLLILEFYGNGATNLAVTAVRNVFKDFTLSAIPLFILIGELLLESGLSARLYRAVSPAFRRVPGGLLHTNIVVTTIFGAVSGSSMSTAAAVGAVAYPEMAKLGYRKPDIVATIAAGGTLGLLIPPSLSLLIYGAITETSIGQLFLAGILPGLLFALLFIGYIAFRLRHARPDDAGPGVGRGKATLAILHCWPIAALIAAIMGSIVAGIATPTEAAGIGVVAAILIGMLMGELGPRRLLRALVRSVESFAVIGFVILGAVILAQSISVLGLPRMLLEEVVALGLDKYVFLLVVILIYLLLGCVFEGLSLMIMTLPIVYPLMTGFGFDPVWVGVLVTVMIEIALITPPVGLNLYVLTALTGQAVTLGEAARATVPFWLLLLAGIVILTIVPEIALLLPGLLR